MIQHVVERACASSADRVLVATDDARIAAAVHDPRGSAQLLAILTDPPCRRVPIASLRSPRSAAGPTTTIVVNLQGDEPFMPAELIDQVARLLGVTSARGNRDAHDAASMASRRCSDPNVVKVVAGSDGCALYFSRAPIPWSRDGVEAGPAGRPVAARWRHAPHRSVRVSRRRAAQDDAAATVPSGTNRKTRTAACTREWSTHRRRCVRRRAWTGNRYRSRSDCCARPTAQARSGVLKGSLQ